MNIYEEQWVRQAMAQSAIEAHCGEAGLLPPPPAVDSGMIASTVSPADVTPILPFQGGQSSDAVRELQQRLLDDGNAAAAVAASAAEANLHHSAAVAHPSADASMEDDELRRALAASAEISDTGGDQAQRHLLQPMDLSDERALQQALRASADAPEARQFGVRRLMGSDGPFYPAGIANSGNSCFWNAMLQVLFAATPVFRGALFQLDPAELRPGSCGEEELRPPADASASASSSSASLGILGLLRDLFAEMDMGLVDAIDAKELYRRIFRGHTEEADVSEQMGRFFDLLASGPGSLKAVCQELFSGDLYEHLQNPESVRRVPLDFCQLNLCVVAPMSLERSLEEHTRDVQGAVARRSYRLPPVLWLNLDRFVYDREAMCGRKRQVRLTFPDVLNAWMLVPPEASWLDKIRTCAERRDRLAEELRQNHASVARCTNGLARSGTSHLDEELARLVEAQEALVSELREANSEFLRCGADQELLYRLQAVIVHRGTVETGHYYAYVRSPDTARTEWCCLNDATVEVCSTEEMQRISEGADDVDANAAVSCPSSVGTSHHEEPLIASDAETVLGGAQPGFAATLSSPKVLVEEAALSQPSTPSAPQARSLPTSPLSRPPKSPEQAGTRRQAFWSCMPSILGGRSRGGGAGARNVSPDTFEVAAPTAPPPYSDHVSAPHALDSDCAKILGGVLGLEGASPSSPSRPATTTPPRGDTQPLPETDFSGTPLTTRSPNKPATQTAARCLVYVRCGPGGCGHEGLLGEVRRRVPSSLQERIDDQNTRFLRERVERIVESFTRCARLLTAHPGGSEEAEIEEKESSRAREALKVAQKVRAESGMARARMLLLRSCWREHVPWMPEELCPTIAPPDFRMYYGSAAKRLLLDALINRGQHDIASLVTADTSDSDAFVPPEMEAWFLSKNL